MVYLCHGILPAFDYLPIKGTFSEKVINTITSGGTGVSIFFVLSGFLITYLLLTERQFSKTIDIRKFYTRRILRIWPLYFAVVTFTFGIYPLMKSFVGHPTDLCSNIWLHLVFLSNFDVIHILKNCYGSDAISQNITWSVSIEEQFYLIWPLLVVATPQRFLPHVICSVILFSMGFQFIYFNDETILYYHTISKLMDLATGGLVAYFTFFSRSFRSFLSRLSPAHHWILFVVTFAWLLLKNDLLTTAYSEVVSKPICVSLFAMIIAAQCFGKKELTPNLGKIRIASAMGKYTYGIYLLHPIVLTLMRSTFRVLHYANDSFISSLIFGLVGLFLTLVVSYLSYQFYESRFLNIKKNYSVVTQG